MVNPWESSSWGKWDSTNPANPIGQKAAFLLAKHRVSGSFVLKTKKNYIDLCDFEVLNYQTSSDLF
jgi:hypothetical protein